MVEKGIRGGIFDAIHRQAKANKYMKNWAMTQKFNEDVIKNYDKDSDKRYIFEVDVVYPKN